MTAPSV